MKIVLISSKNQNQEANKIEKAIIDLLNDFKIQLTKNIQQANLAIIIGGDGTLLFWQSQIYLPDIRN